MRRPKPDLIVPIRDRRQRRRILTLKNFRNAFLVVIGLAAVMTIAASLRGRNARSGDFGRLSGRQMEPVAVAKQPVVAPAPAIADADAADPMLVQAQARAQFLQADSRVPAPLTTASAMPQPEMTHADGDEHVTIVGGPEGVSLIKRTAERPVLSGGFGRQ